MPTAIAMEPDKEAKIEGVSKKYSFIADDDGWIYPEGTILEPKVTSKASGKLKKKHNPIPSRRSASLRQALRSFLFKGKKEKSGPSSVRVKSPPCSPQRYESNIQSAATGNMKNQRVVEGPI